MLYLKALHIIFIVTWFAGMFYMPRLFIYNTEAQDKSPEIRDAFRAQFAIMLQRLWYGITWPSAIITLVLGPTLMVQLGYWSQMGEAHNMWLNIKLGFVVLLYAYHYSLHIIFKQQCAGIFKYSSQQLRIWNEIATIFLIAIVMLVVVRQAISLVWGVLGLVLFIVLLMSAIKIYKNLRKDKK
ncbi:MAG: CopD family protein [Chitinophagaceae bacterium]|nr:CopD family protein [Chitinophagaceae bacterium]